MKLWLSIKYKHIKKKWKESIWIFIVAQHAYGFLQTPVWASPEGDRNGGHADIETLRQSRIYINYSNIINKSRKRGTLQ